MSGLSRLAQAQEEEVVTAASALAEDGGRLQVGLVRQLAPQRVRVALNEKNQTLLPLG
jgi:hypothetical protein